jgi:hypothetical protein
MSAHYRSPFIRFHMSPVAIAMTAGAIGSICGALFVAVLAMPSTQSSDLAQSRPAETTGAAGSVQEQQPVKTDMPPAATAEAAASSSGDDESKRAAAAECDRQAWPYITQQCLAERSAGQRRVRVITTDNIAAPVVDAIETSRELPGARGERRQDMKAKEPPAAPTASAPVVAAPADPARGVEAKAAPAVEASAAPAPQHTSPGEGGVATAASVVPAAAPVVESKPQHASVKEERGKKARDRRKREAKSRRTSPPERDDDEAGDTGSRTTRAVERDDSGSDRRGRIVERWTEREYDVPSYNGSQRRRVIVIRRDGDRADAYMPSADGYSRSLFRY